MKFARYLGVLLCLSLAPLTVQSQDSQIIHGKILTQNNNPIGRAHISLPDLNINAVSDSTGHFKLLVPTSQKQSIVVSHVGYQAFRKKLTRDLLQADTLSLKLKSRRYHAADVVVTATRTRRDIEDVPEPVTVISDKEIQTSGSTRLGEILAEQTGLTLTDDHGTGVQVQGFSSEYTKIMIDGQPLIGRTAGTLNLDRISVGNVKQVEMVKGPSSALWGSDALAGVVNIITDKGRKPFEMGINSRYATNQTVDLGINLSGQVDSWQNTLFLNRNSSQGYSLKPDALSKTVPEYQNYTASYQTSWDLSDLITAEFQGRYYRERQTGTDYLGSTQNPTMLDRDALQEDYSITPTLHFDLGSGFKAEISNNYSRYRTDTQIDYQQGDSLYEQTNFDQHYNKSELQLNKSWNTKHITTLGSGYVHERLNAQRYPAQPSFNSYFVYAQHEWMPTAKWDLIAGFRYDEHSEYRSQLSPKFSARYKLFKWMHLRASAGSGFKAPDFRQLFLDFTNSTVGYTVFGSNTVQQRVQNLQDRGQIDQILSPLDQLSKIRAEQSWAYNAGIDLFPSEELSIRINGFQNNVDDLIESAPVATKTNGQSIFTYFNLEKVYTRGIETQLRWKPNNQFEFSGGYQFLDARRQINETRKVINEEGAVVEKEFSSYEPMFNRSKHSANLKAFYFWDALDVDANIRGSWHGRYGRIDANGNGFVDSGEYEDSYMIWDASLAKTFRDRYTLRLGADNILGLTRPSDLPHLSGRIFYARLSLQLY